MTDSNPPIKRRLWERLTWPQVAALAIAVGGVVSLLHSLPPEAWEHIDAEQIASVIAILFGLGGSAVSDRLLRGANQ